MWRWCIVSKRLNSLSWFLVWGLPRRKSTLYEMGFWIPSCKGRPPRRCVVGLTHMFGCHYATVVRPSSRWALGRFSSLSCLENLTQPWLFIVVSYRCQTSYQYNKYYALVYSSWWFLFIYHDYKVVWTFGRQTTWSTDVWATHHLRTQGFCWRGERGGGGEPFSVGGILQGVGNSVQ